MKSYKSTIALFVITALVVGVTAYELSTEDKRKEAESAKDKVFKDISKQDVSGIIIDNGLGLPVLKISKSETDWNIESPIKDKAESTQATSFIADIFNESIQSLDLNGKSIESFGFSDKPIRLVLQLKKPNATATTEKILLMSQIAAVDGSRYLQFLGESKVYIGDKNWTALLTKSPQDLRDKVLWSYTEDITEFKLKNPTSKSELNFKKVDNNWVEQNNPKINIDQNEVASFISGVRNARALNWLSEDKTNAQLKSFGLTGNTSYVTLNSYRIDYNLTSDSLNGFNTTRPGIMRINASDKNLWKKSLNDFRDKKYPFQFKPEDATQLTIEVKGKKYDITAANSMKPILDKLSELKASDFAGGSTISGPKNTINVVGKEGKSLLSIVTGSVQNKSGKETYLAKTNLSDEILLVDASQLDPIFDIKSLDATTAPKEETKQETPPENKN